MEVHHHPHAQKKKFKEYFLEFLMIFLAVTLGFFAEGLREHISDRRREKDYLSAMIEELKSDTAAYNKGLNKIAYLRPLLDSLVINVKNAKNYNYILSGKWNTPINETGVPYLPTLLTIQQLKSSGNLRLIESKTTLKKILEYDSYIQGAMKSETENVSEATERIFAFEDNMCDETEFNKQTDDNMQATAAQYNMENGSIYDMRFLVRDSVSLNQFANSFINYKSRNWGYYTRLNTAKQMAAGLIEDINKEYGLK